LADPSFVLAVESIAPGPDDDRDGLPDAWEMRHAGTLSLLRADHDQDADGLSDHAEYAADTDPFDDTDLLRIGRVSFDPGAGLLTVSWNGRPTRSYAVMGRSSLGPSEPWVELDWLPAGLSPIRSITLSLPFPSPVAFFAIKAVPAFGQ
jgi:hypothetical protein